MSDLLLVIHAAVSWALLGLIWTIQVVHYPLFKEVGKESFIAYHERHMRFITWVVGLLMLAEVGSAAVLLNLGGELAAVLGEPCRAGACVDFYRFLSEAV